MKRFIGVFVPALFLIAVITSYMTFAQSYEWTENTIIAHAGGGIEGDKYTNSLEAFQNSYKKGHRLIELDINMTSDGKVVARHDWKDTKDQTYETFKNRLYKDKYKPIDFQQVIKLLKKYDDVYIILDGKTKSPQAVQTLYKKINVYTKNLKPRDKNRLIPQMFYKQDYQLLKNYGFKDVLYVIGRESYTNQSLAEFCDERGIRAVSIDKTFVNTPLVQTLKKKKIVSYTYTVNDRGTMKRHKQMGVHGFFSDFVDAY